MPRPARLRSRWAEVVVALHDAATVRVLVCAGARLKSGGSICPGRPDCEVIGIEVVVALHGAAAVCALHFFGVSARFPCVPASQSATRGRRYP